MADEHYTVKINRRDGVVEITGTDKEWIAEQIEALRVVYEQQPDEVTEAADSPPLDPDAAAEQQPAGDAETNGKLGTKPRRARGGGFRGTRISDLANKLDAETRARLEKHMSEREAGIKDAPDRAAVVAAFLEDTLKLDSESPNDLYTVADVMGWPTANPRNALDNGKTRKKYFTSAGRGRYRLTHTGQHLPATRRRPQRRPHPTPETSLPDDPDHVLDEG